MLSGWAACLAMAPLGAAPITERSLLAEYTDFDRLTRPPAIWHSVAQASSYDRASTRPGDESWFANADAGKYLRTEIVDGRTERVMLDAEGPGALVRIWSANPAGTLRFYFDGSAAPQFTVATNTLLGGKVPGLDGTFAYVAARGWNLYYPIPYARSLKLTAEGPGTEHMYYHVGYRTYPVGTPLATLDVDIKARPMDALEATKQALDPPPIVSPRRTYGIGAGRSHRVFERSGGGTIRTLTLQIAPRNPKTLAGWADPKADHNVLRRLRIRAWFDGEACIDVPLSDFFGSGVGLNEYDALPMQVRRDGRLVCRFPMPFRRSALIEIRNGNPGTVQLGYDVSADTRRPAEGTYLFKAQWLSYRGPSRPFQDLPMLHFLGEGWLVGSSLAIENSRPEWWGEGDEKIWVDGEKFPSTFGTGTEDFYGYAWCDPTPFARPFHAQPRADGPGNFGHTTVNRWFIGDAIPFRREIRFDVELWHWASCPVKFSRVSYWYAKPGGGAPAPVDESLLLPAELVPNPPVKGAIEGESLAVVSRSGGELEAQGGFWELSGGKQLWWIRMKPGDKLTLRVPVPGPGRYEVVGNFCRNRDYGRHRLTIGSATRVIDYFHSSLVWEKFTLGEVESNGDPLILTVESLGKRPEALDGNMFGLDYLLLVKK